MTKEPTKQGETFRKKLADSKIKKVDFAKRMDLANAQTLSNWYKRGVPSKLSLKAAAILGCEADEISEITLAEPVDNEKAQLARQKREMIEAYESLVNEQDDPRILKLLRGNLDSFLETFGKKT